MRVELPRLSAVGTSEEPFVQRSSKHNAGMGRKHNDRMHLEISEAAGALLPMGAAVGA